MATNEDKADVRHQTALSVLKILVATPQGYSEEEVALMAVNIADFFLDGLSKPPYTVKTKLQDIQKRKNLGQLGY